MIDRSLNYGRNHIRKFLTQSDSLNNVLDLGAGHGDDLLSAKKVNPDVELLAIESFPPYVKELKEKGITVYSADIEKNPLPFKDESVDVVIMNQILEHVKEVFWILHEVTRILKKGGSLIIGVPNLASFHNRILLMLGQQPTSIKNNSAHVRGYTKSDFKKLLDSGFEGGYKLTGFGGGNFYPFPPLLAKPLSQLLPSMAWGIFMHFKKKSVYKTNGYLTYPVENKLETKFYLGE